MVARYYYQVVEVVPFDSSATVAFQCLGLENVLLKVVVAVGEILE